ncbi:PKG_39 [Blepharisma stoltei]|uniref:cGMP-dependent protein kinase n=1 Tax=Blepharisma stoltei TaxID=1481888 RepID=A0AAU9K1Q6_9CILI|nr:unnamed protein product [Blepharisma stoltei]
MGCSCVKSDMGRTSGYIVPENQFLEINKKIFSKESTDFHYPGTNDKRSTAFKQRHQKPIIDLRRMLYANSEASSAIVNDKEKTKEDIKLILDVINKHSILQNLDEDSQMVLVKNMRFYEIGPRECIFEQGQPGFCFYVLSSGRVELRVDNERKDILKSGSGFGELALLDDRPRSATVRTIESCCLWGVSRETFKDAVKKIMALNYEENKNFIESVPIFKTFTNSQKDALLSSLVTQRFSIGERIVKQGDTGDLFYIIKDGLVSCTENDREIRQMGKGEYFGELALLNDFKRTATITAVGDVKLVSIGRKALIEVLGNNLEQIWYRNALRISVEKSSALKILSIDQKELIFNLMKVTSYKAGELVIPRGTPKGRNLWITTKGLIRGPLGTIEAYSCIGDEELLADPYENYSVDFISESDLIVAHITKEEIEKSMEGTLIEIQAMNEIIEILKSVQLLKELSIERFKLLISVLREVHYTDNQIIVEQNSLGDSFFIVKSGKVHVQKDGVNIRNITKHDYFGERSVLFNDFKRSATVVANGEVDCWIVEKKDFLNIIDEGIKVQLLKRIELQDDMITFDEILPIKTLGRGNFGTVYLTAHKRKKAFYALKSVLKAKVYEYETYQNILLERNILLQLDHNMIVKLVKTFKDDSRFYFLMEYVHGQDLFDVLLALNILSENDAKFYAGCLVLMLQYLHERDIIYRDLKPENVMIDEEGYPKLIDFGAAKVLHGRSYTTVGTPHYMAPEVFLGAGYSMQADLWSLGVMIYEFLYGKLPFGENLDDPHEIYEKILEYRLCFPRDLDSAAYSKNLIQQLLNKNPALRMGGVTSKLKEHKWFLGLPWERIITKQQRAPHIPKLRSLSSELANAKKRNKTMQEFIAFEEQNENFPRSPENEPPGGWDMEF